MAELRFHAAGLSKAFKLVLLLGINLVLAYFIFSQGIKGAAILLLLPFVLTFGVMLFLHPKISVYFVLIMGFLAPFFGRYAPGIPYGLTIDLVLVLGFVALFLKYFRDLDMRLMRNEVMLLMALWMGYIILQLGNPEARSAMAWFYSMRGIALYQLLLMGLAFLIFKDRKAFYHFLNLWFGLSLFGVLWGLKQQMFGVDAAEQAWLDSGPKVTHILFGKLRIFSYYYDAGTFGAAMGHTATMAGILAMGPYSRVRKIFYLVVCLTSLYAMIISGTRGALAVPGVGGLIFLILNKNVKFIVLGGLIMLGSFVFLKYTYIMQDNYNISRLRTALDAEDPSLRVRLRNRAALTEYLKGRPFGGGVGSVGDWGRKFSPGTWLSEFEPDGLYTRIRAETGLIGRNVYVCIWIFFLIRGAIFTWKYEDLERKYLSMALLSGYGGILLANYGNQVMTQFPISILVFLSIPFIYNMRFWNADGSFNRDAALAKRGLFKSELKRRKLLDEPAEE